MNQKKNIFIATCGSGAGREAFMEMLHHELDHKIMHGHYSFEPEPPIPTGIFDQFHKWDPIPEEMKEKYLTAMKPPEITAIPMGVDISSGPDLSCEIYGYNNNGVINITGAKYYENNHTHVWKDTKDRSGDKVCSICGIRAMVGRMKMKGDK